MMDFSSGRSILLVRRIRTDEMLRPQEGKIQPSGRSRDATFSVDYCYRFRSTTSAFATDNPTLHEVFDDADGMPARALVFVDQGLYEAQPDLAKRIEAYAAANADQIDLVEPPHPVPGGESSKNKRAIFDDVLTHIHAAALCRRSYVVVVGGGAVLDVVGFAAATAHRGVRLIRLPSTTLSQADSGVGVKNGLNAFGKKNYWGSFSVPWAVINDAHLLATLSDRDWRSGFSETVKVALIKDRAFFDHICAVATRIAARALSVATPVIDRACQLHFEHIVDGGDPLELTVARPLDFGHWAAHKLEQMTNFRLHHGEAVAIGLALDVTYAARLGLLPWQQVSTIFTCLRNLGFCLYDEALTDRAMLWAGLDEFREHLGGKLAIPVVDAIGHSIVVPEIDRAQMSAAIDHLAEQDGKAGDYRLACDSDTAA